jgi:hypothetical protein
MGETATSRVLARLLHPIRRTPLGQRRSYLRIFDSVPNSPRRGGSGPIGGALRCGLDLPRLVHGPKPRDPRLNYADSSWTLLSLRIDREPAPADPAWNLGRSASKQIDLRLRTDMCVMLFCGLLAKVSGS